VSIGGKAAQVGGLRKFRCLVTEVKLPEPRFGAMIASPQLDRRLGGVTRSGGTWATRIMR